MSVMSEEIKGQAHWDAVIAAHPLESHDPQEWLRYGMALLLTIQPGEGAGKQQQQAALAFLQAQREGAEEGAVAEAQVLAARLALEQALQLAGFQSGTPPQESALHG